MINVINVMLLSGYRQDRSGPSQQLCDSGPVRHASGPSQLIRDSGPVRHPDDSDTRGSQVQHSSAGNCTFI